MTQRRLLVTGGRGQLGSEIAAVAERHGYQVWAPSHAELDVLDVEAVDRALATHRPEALINCAGWTDVDGAESAPDEAFAVNAIGARIQASACDRHHALMVHISTDYVFDGGAHEPIDEWTQPSPLSTYGRSKLAGEVEVRRVAPRHQVVRTSWLFGRDGPNFVLTILRLKAEGAALRVVDDQRGAPTWTGHLAPAVLRLVERGVPGTYHLSSAGSTTWHAFAVRILGQAGYDDEVTPISTPERGQPAPRPAYSLLDNRAWRLLGEPPLPGWRHGLAAYLDELRDRGVQMPAPGAQSRTHATRLD